MINRRKLITTSASSLLVASSTKSFADCNDKPKTPSQVTGPFYKNTFDQKNSDLTYNNGRASGEIIKITGTDIRKVILILSNLILLSPVAVKID